MKILFQLGLAVFAVLGVRAQVAPGADPCAAPADRPKFDVVSIKPATTAGEGWIRPSADGLTFTGAPNRVIRFAYNLLSFQLAGGPDWMRTQNWEIRAKSDSPDTDFAQLSDAQRQALWDKRMQQLQSMLADRFQFKCHMTQKEMPVYELVIAKGGTKLKESTAEGANRGYISIEGHGLSQHADGKAVGLDRIAGVLSGPTGRMVLDKTGLTGSYDFSLDWTNEALAGAETPPEASSGATIFTAVEEQLGLKLQPAKGPVPVMMVDQVEKPTEN